MVFGTSLGAATATVGLSWMAGAGEAVEDAGYDCLKVPGPKLGSKVITYAYEWAILGVKSPTDPNLWS